MWDKGYKKVQCESDCMHGDHLFGLIVDIRQMLQRDWDIHLAHVYREANACSDQLTKSGVTESSEFVVLQDPPAGILPFLSVDVVGTLFSRV